jgi:hypothetical protein
MVDGHANRDSGRLQPGPGRFVFVPDSRADEVDDHWPDGGDEGHKE